MDQSDESVQAALIGNFGSLRRIQIVKVKRGRDPETEESSSAGRRIPRRRKLGMQAVFQFKSVMKSDTQAQRRNRNRKRRFTRMRLPTQPQLTYKERKKLSRDSILRRRPGKPLDKKQIVEIDAEIRESIRKFQPYRQRVFTEDQSNYLLTVYNQMFPQPDQPLTFHEELIKMYKDSTDERERRHLRKDYGVVREMVLAEEGMLPDDESTEEEEVQEDIDDYDYYVQDDTSQFDMYLDEYGNFVEGANFEEYGIVGHPAGESSQAFMSIDQPESKVKDHCSTDEEDLHF